MGPLLDRCDMTGLWHGTGKVMKANGAWPPEEQIKSGPDSVLCEQMPSAAWPSARLALFNALIPGREAPKILLLLGWSCKSSHFGPITAPLVQLHKLLSSLRLGAAAGLRGRAHPKFLGARGWLLQHVWDLPGAPGGAARPVGSWRGHPGAWEQHRQRVIYPPSSLILWRNPTGGGFFGG